MLITYPLLTVVDDSGVIVSGATVTITSIKDKAGVDIATPGASLNQSGPNVSVDYDALLKGEAWITLAVSKVGSTFTNLNAAPPGFLSKDPAYLRLAAGMTAGLCSGAGTGTETFKGPEGNTAAVVTVDDDGNRTGVAYS